MNIVYIYELSDPVTGEPRYIGKSCNPDRRYREHLKEDSNTYKCNWIKSLLKKGLVPDITIIDETSDIAWSFLETYYIAQYREWGFNLTNTGDGGEGWSGDETTKEKLREINKAARERGSYDAIDLSKIRPTKEDRRSRCKEVEMYKEDQLVATFNSLPELSESLGYNQDRVREVLVGYKNKGKGLVRRVESYKGYTFKYKTNQT